MIITLFAAVARNNVIGADNKLLWQLPDDFKWMQQHTAGKTLIMGRKTHESIGRVLPNRLNIVISRQYGENRDNLVWAPSLEDAIAVAECTDNAFKKDDELIIFGGGQVYAEALPLARRMYLTEVNATPDGDTFFPAFNRDAWQRTVLAQHSATNGQPAFQIAKYDHII